MIDALLYGLGIGFMLCITLGTVFFALIQNSIDFGFKTGFFIASGVVLSDMILISLALLGTQSLPDIPNFKLYVSIVCAALLIVMGAASFFKKEPQLIYPKTKFGNVLYFGSTGFLLNILNPVNFIVWAAIASKVKTANGYNQTMQIVFFIGCLISIFTTEISISFFAAKLKKFFTTKVLMLINRFTGLVFIVIAMKIIYDLF